LILLFLEDHLHQHGFSDIGLSARIDHLNIVTFSNQFNKILIVEIRTGFSVVESSIAIAFDHDASRILIALGFLFLSGSLSCRHGGTVAQCSNDVHIIHISFKLSVRCNCFAGANTARALIMALIENSNLYYVYKTQVNSRIIICFSQMQHFLVDNCIFSVMLWERCRTSAILLDGKDG